MLRQLLAAANENKNKEASLRTKDNISGRPAFRPDLPSPPNKTGGSSTERKKNDRKRPEEEPEKTPLQPTRKK